jgi:hypothetical protein
MSTSDAQMRMVDLAEWDLSGMEERDRDRAARLLDPPSGEELISAVAAQALEAAIQGRSSWSWQHGKVMAGCGRAIGSFPLYADTFDALFNGRSGYRAQYYLSCQEGIEFNARLISALQKPLRLACERAPTDLVASLQHSFEGPYSKIWVLCDGGPFCGAPKDEFKPRSWFERNPASMGLRAPFPDLPGIEIKGSWMNNSDHHYQEDTTWKGDRHRRLAETGFV